MVVVPAYTTFDKARQICKKRNVILLEIDVPIATIKPNDHQTTEDHQKLIDACKLACIHWEHEHDQRGFFGVPDEDRQRYRTWTAEQVYGLFAWAAEYSRREK